MSNQVEQIRIRVKTEQKLTEGLFEKGDNSYFDGQNDAYDTILRFIDSLPTKETPLLVPESKETPIEVCGKKVMVRYTRDGQPCEKCVFGEKDSLCQRVRDECSRLDKVGMEIDERAYFVPAEESEPKNWPADKDNLVGKQAGESVDRWVVTNAFLHCDRAGKIVSEMYGDKFNNSRNRDKYLAFLQQVNFDDRFGELAEILQRYGAMPAPKEQPETDFDELIKQEMVKVYETYTRPDYIEENTTAAAYDFDTHIARHFYNLNPKHK